MDMDNDEDFLIRKHPELEPAFERFIRLKAEEAFDNGVREISSMISESGDIQVWRALVVDRNLMTQGMDDKPIGQCWSFNEYSAKPYCGEGWGTDTIDVRIEAFVSTDDVDWEQTMLLYTAAAYTVGEENEIFLLPSTMIDVVGVKQTHTAEPLEVKFSRGTKILVAGGPDREMGPSAP